MGREASFRDMLESIHDLEELEGFAEMYFNALPGIETKPATAHEKIELAKRLAEWRRKRGKA